MKLGKDALTRLYDVTQAVIYLPGVDRAGVQSLWTPNSYVNEITEEGFRADQIIDSTITPEALTPEALISAGEMALERQDLFAAAQAFTAAANASHMLITWMLLAVSEGTRAEETTAIFMRRIPPVSFAALLLPARAMPTL